MNYGLYLSAGGALTSMHRQDVIANNLANLNTVGFKPDEVLALARLPERLETGAAVNGDIGGADLQIMLEQLGGGQLINPTRISLRQGVLQQTGNDLDLAIDGAGFFVVSRKADANPQNLRFTRDGRFTLNARGELVMTTTGMRALDVENQPIQLDRGAPVTIDARGAITQRGTVVAQLQVSEVRDAARLVKEGDGVMRLAGTLRPHDRLPATGAVQQRQLEGSAVDPILALNAMINASKSVAANASMMQYHDHLMDQAVNTFGRVA